MCWNAFPETEKYSLMHCPTLGAILISKGAKKSKGSLGGEKQHKGGENAQPLIDH